MQEIALNHLVIVGSDSFADATPKADIRKLCANKKEGVDYMKVFRVVYFLDGFQRISIVAAENNDKAGKLVSKKKNIEVYSIKECDLTNESIIHTEVIEVV